MASTSVLQDVPGLLADYEAQRVEVAGRIQLLSQRAPDFVAARGSGTAGR